MFWYYSRNILVRLSRSKKDHWNTCYFWRQLIEKMNEKTKFHNFRTWQHRKEEAGLQKHENFVIHAVVKGLILVSLKFKSGNVVKFTKSNLKEEKLKTVVCIFSSK